MNRREVIHNEINLVCQLIQDNTPHFGLTFENLEPEEIKKLKIQLENLLKALDPAARVYEYHTVKTRDIPDLIIDIRKLLEACESKLKKQKYEGKSLISFQNLHERCNKLFWTLNSLKPSGKETEIIARGTEVVVKGIPMYIYKDKVVKRLIETEHEVDIKNYIELVGEYNRIMNGFHDHFGTWDTQNREIKRDTVNKKGQKITLYILYAIQQRFDKSVTLSNILRHNDINVFKMLYKALIQVLLRMYNHNSSHPNKQVSFDMNHFNLICPRVGNDFKIYSFDYNIPFIKSADSDTSYRKLWDLMHTEKKSFGLKTMDKVHKRNFFNTFEKSFDPYNNFEKLLNCFYFNFKGSDKTLKQEMKQILEETLDEYGVGGDLKTKLMAIPITKRIYLFKHGYFDTQLISTG